MEEDRLSRRVVAEEDWKRGRFSLGTVRVVFLQFYGSCSSAFTAAMVVKTCLHRDGVFAWCCLFFVAAAAVPVTIMFEQ